ncbi:MAG: four helix bundle protein [Anaerolineae bacterium]
MSASSSIAKSTADMLARLGIVEEETDETIYWIELLVDAEIVQRQRVNDLLCEVNEILAMTVA